MQCRICKPGNAASTGSWKRRGSPQSLRREPALPTPQLHSPPTLPLPTLEPTSRISQAVQGLTICLPTQEDLQVLIPVLGRSSSCLPGHLGPVATTTEPTLVLEPMLCNREAATVKPTPVSEAATRESPRAVTRTQRGQNQSINNETPHQKTKASCSGTISHPL